MPSTLHVPSRSRCSTRVTVLTLLVALAMAGAVANAAAQTPEGLVEVREDSRRGFWLGLGVGAGGESYDLQPSAGYSDVLYRPPR